MHRGVLSGAPMSFLPRLRRLAVTLSLLAVACTTEPSPVMPPGEGFVRLDNEREGLSNGSMLTAFTDIEGTQWVGGNIGALLRRPEGGAWSLEVVPVTGIVTGMWQDATGHLLITAGSE